MKLPDGDQQKDFQLEEPLQASRHHLVEAWHHTRCGVHARGRAGVCTVPTDLYDQGLLTPLPAVLGSKRFPDKEVVAITYIMVIVAHPSGQNIANNDPNGFGCMCLMGLWGLHTETVLQQCHKMCADGVNRITVGFCLFCEFWMTNDSVLNNHVRKHYGIAMSCYHDGYTTGSVMTMKCHMTTKHGIVMESAPEKHKRTK